MRRKSIARVQTVVESFATNYTVNLQVLYVGKHTRAVSPSKLFGDEYFVVANIPELDTHAVLAGPYRKLEEANAAFREKTKRA